MTEGHEPYIELVRRIPLVEHIRTSLIIQAEMFRRILDGDPRPSLLLAEVLEDAGNRYIDFSEMVSTMSKDEASG